MPVSSQLHSWNPYHTDVLSGSFASSDEGSQVVSTAGTGSVGEDTFKGPIPNVIRRLPTPLESRNLFGLVAKLSTMSPARMSRFLSRREAMTRALLDGLFEDPNLRASAGIPRGSVLSSTMEIAVEFHQVRAQLLFEAILMDPTLIERMCFAQGGAFPLTALYDLAGKEWMLRLHKRIMPRLGMLCCHPHGYYVLAHLIERFPDHQDEELMRGVARWFMDGNQFFSACMDQFGVFVAITWSKVVSASDARAVALSWINHPNAQSNFYCATMSAAASKAIFAVLMHLQGTADSHLLTSFNLYGLGSTCGATLV